MRWIYSFLVLMALLSGHAGFCAVQGLERQPSVDRPLAGRAEPSVKIIVADDNAYAPFAFIDSAGQPRGISIDIWRLWSQKTGIDVEFRLMEWEAALTAVKEGRADVVGGLFRTPQREPFFDFTKPYFTIATGLFFHSQIHGLQGFADLGDFTVGVVKGDSAEEWIRARHPTIRLETYPDTENLVKTALAGEIKVFVADSHVAQFYLAKLDSKEEIREAVNPVSVSPQYAAVRKGNRQLLTIIQQGFDQISEQEKRAIVETWTGRPVLFKVPWAALGITLVTIATVLGLLLLWNLQLKRKVAQATIDLQQRNAALRASEQQLRDIANNIPGVVYQFYARPTGEQGLYYFSTRAAEIFGIEPRLEDAFARFAAQVAPEDQEPFLASIQQAVATAQRWDFEGRFIKPTGEVIWFKGVSSPKRLAQELVFTGIILDITERKRAEERQRLAAAVFEAAREAILVADPAGRIVAVNPAFTALTGYAETDVLGRSPRLLWAERQPATYFADLWQTVLQEGVWHGEFWSRRKDGELRAALASLATVRDAAQRIIHYVGIATDITAAKAAEQRIEHLAYYDALTDLPNRALLDQRAELALALTARRGGTLAVLFMDLDRFKEVNDSLGHAEGDALLIQVAARLQTLTRAEDTVCRLGGDEFVVLLPDADQDGALRVADKVLAAFRQPFAVAGHDLQITVSIGIALYPHDGADFAELLKNADAALHQAKINGRNARLFYDRRMNAATFERLLLDAELRQAITSSQLRAYYQPKVRLTDGMPVGAEALVRWQHPTHGLIPPGQFIPVAEASDLIIALGDWMLAEVCRQMEVWRRQGLPALTVAVNLAARHFRCPGLADHLQGLLEAYGLPAQALELELTESTLLEVGADTAATLAALARLGVGLALDDFGTGYSSLSYLKRLPLTALKIDRSFVRDLASDPEDRVLAATIVTLGHQMGLEVVAEGVETEEQRRILIDQGCDLAQGYWFGRPAPAEEFAEWLRNASSDKAIIR